MDRWVGKTAVVTGASAGIGAAVCVALANEGIRVVGLARRAAVVEELQSKVHNKDTIIPRKCDVSSAEEVAATFQWIERTLGAVHIMINNAGVYHPGGITDVGNNIMNEEDMLATLDINVKGTMLCTRHAVNSMKKHGVDGHIINMNSVVGHYVPLLPTFNVYPTTKHAITGFTAALLNELSHYKNKIKVTSLSPGLVHTEMDGVLYLKKFNLPALEVKDVTDAVLYVLSTPPHVNSLSPGLVHTEMDGVLYLKKFNLPALEVKDVTDAVLYVLSTPPHVNINELTISIVTEKRA